MLTTKAGVRLGILTIALGMAALAGRPLSAAAQGKDEPWEILISYNKDKAPQAVPWISLRPNVGQPVLIYLRNNAPLAKRDLKITLRRFDAKDKLQTIADCTVDKIGKEQEELLVFKAIPVAKGETPPVISPLPPFKFRIVIEEKGQDPVFKDLEARIEKPHAYVGAKASFVAESKKLTVTVKRKNPDYIDPDCKIKLTVPGLVVPEDATLIETLTAKQGVKSVHTRLQFPPNLTPKKPRVYLTVDDYDRAFMFEGAWDEGDLAELEAGYRARLIAPRVFLPKPVDLKDPKADPKAANLMTVFLEVDGLKRPDAKVEVAIGTTDGRFNEIRKFPALRLQSLSVLAGEEGKLIFDTKVSDWKVDVDTTGLFGKRLLRVRILDASDQPLRLEDESDLILFSPDPVLNPLAPLTYDRANKGAVYAEVMINPKGPDFLLQLPKSAYPGEKIALKLNAAPRDRADLEKVDFFVDDAKREKAIAAIPDKEKKIWMAEYTVPTTAKEKLIVGVQVSCVLGLAGTKAGEIPIVAAPVPVAKITGVVKHGSDLQEGVNVFLVDDKGKKIANKKTDKAGVYLFDPVDPGTYTVIAARPIPALVGKATVTVPKEKTVTADIDLRISGK